MPARTGDGEQLRYSSLGEGDRREALDAGFQWHLAKSIDIDRLLEAVARLGEGREVGSAAAVEAKPASAPSSAPSNTLDPRQPLPGL
jgi:hypothetical protein